MNGTPSCKVPCGQLRILFTVFALLAGTSCARRTYQTEIPNGIEVARNGVVWSAGHVAPDGSSSLSDFGESYRREYQWTTALCQEDSDRDGYTNGEELGDPRCVWKPGSLPSRSTGISHPGFADSVPDLTMTARVASPTATSAIAGPGLTGANETTRVASPSRPSSLPTEGAVRAPFSSLASLAPRWIAAWCTVLLVALRVL